MRRFATNNHMNPLGTSLRNLREFTGLTIGEFAARAGVSKGLLQNYETAKVPPAQIKRTTATQILRAAESVRPIPAAIHEAFAAAAGLPTGDQLQTLIGAVTRATVPAGQLERIKNSPRFQAYQTILGTAGALSPDERHLVIWLFDLIDSVGVENVNKAMISMAAMSGTTLTPIDQVQSMTANPASPIRSFDVVSPPVQRRDPGTVPYVEKTITTYDVHPRGGKSQKASKSPPKGKQRDAS